jgi:DNA-binding transcriptional LysR family regulator
MDTELLKTFLEVEKTRHFGKAAENLYLTPAAVSARVRQLEGIIGSPLVTRNRNNMRLTPAGEKLKPRAHEVLDALARAIHEPASMPRGAQRLSLGGTPNMWDYVLKGHLGPLNDSYPELSLFAECHDSDYLVSQIQSRQLDLALVFDPFELKGISCEPLLSMEMALLSTNSSATTRSARHSNYVLIDWSVGFGMAHSQIYGPDLKPSLISSTGKIGLDFLLQQGGAGYFPKYLDKPSSDANRLYLVTDAKSIHLNVFIMYIEGSKKQPLIDSVSKFLRESLLKTYGLVVV